MITYYERGTVVRMFDIKIIQEHNFRDGIITDLETWGNGDIVLHGEFPQIGRASCRDRVFCWV